MASDPMTADERRMLELLAASGDGCTEAILLAHGFAPKLIDGIVSAGPPARATIVQYSDIVGRPCQKVFRCNPGSL